jgi:hypothetical protein
MAKTPNEQTVTFFTPWQIYVASCLGSPLAAAWLVVRNHQGLAQPEQVRRAVLLGLAATVVVVAVALALPENAPYVAWPFLYSVATYFYARWLFGAPAAAYYAKGGRRGSWLRVVVVSLGFFVVLFGAVLALIWAAPGVFGA